MPDQFTIPPGLQSLLQRDTTVDAAVGSAKARFEGLLKYNRPVFFPEYTDHGITHVNRVLATSWSLATDEARALLSARDAACLIISGILHDLAMHIGPAGLGRLVRGKTKLKPVPWLQPLHPEQDWPIAWAEFLQRASRYDARENQQKFGTPEPVTPPEFDENGNTDLKKWTTLQYLFCGEFLRIHHARLAHEFALYGFPGVKQDEEVIHFVNVQQKEKLADLAGFVARSHNMPLRVAVDALADKGDASRPPGPHADNHRQPSNIYAPFLMALVRVADYLQVDADRAPAAILSLSQTLYSPLSSREWRTHDAVEQITPDAEDVEAIKIIARPQHVDEYLNLSGILKGIQHELDQSWSVLGELYSRSKPDLGLVIRRVRSNLDNVNTFARTVDYLPAHVSFTTAGPDLLKLLIGPLYNNRPEIGVRELIQNAVDAVRELEDILPRLPAAQQEQIRRDRYQQKHDVELAIETDPDGSKWLRCTDRGRGMSEHIIREYFLKAGASFRTSDAWHKAHDQKDGDPDPGKPRIVRTGRFGVGALAMFLLVDPEYTRHQIEVTTRAFDHAQGLTFKTRLDADSIEISRVSAPVGTRIRVRLAGKVAVGLFNYAQVPLGPLGRDFPLWEWFVEDKPTVAASGLGPPGQRNAERSLWMTIDQDVCEEIAWLPIDLGWRFGIAVNGFVVAKAADKLIKTDSVLPFEDADLNLPPVRITDRSQRVDIRLDRLALAGSLPAEDALRIEVVDNIIAWALTTAPASPDTPVRSQVEGYRLPRHLPVQSPASALRAAFLWFVSGSGAVLSRAVLRQKGTSRPIIALGSAMPPGAVLGQGWKKGLVYYDSVDPIDIKGVLSKVSGGVEYKIAKLGSYQFHYDAAANPVALRSRIDRNLAPDMAPTVKAYAQGAAVIDPRAPKEALEFFDTLIRTDGSLPADFRFVCLWPGHPVPNLISRHFVQKLKALFAKDEPATSDPITNRWLNLVGDEIPFDPAARQALIDRLRPALGPHLDYWARACEWWKQNHELDEETA